MTDYPLTHKRTSPIRIYICKQYYFCKSTNENAAVAVYNYALAHRSINIHISFIVYKTCEQTDKQTDKMYKYLLDLIYSVICSIAITTSSLLDEF